MTATGTIGRGSLQWGRPPGRSGGIPVDEHGRRLSTNAEAAVHYRRAQRAHNDTADTVTALRHALDADPAFAVAAADLAALTGTTSYYDRTGLTGWERRHLDVVGAVASGEPVRAAGLLREHLVDAGCDPLAVAAVTLSLSRGDHRAQLDDLPNPACHPRVISPDVQAGNEVDRIAGVSTERSAQP